MLPSPAGKGEEWRTFLQFGEGGGERGHVPALLTPGKQDLFLHFVLQEAARKQQEMLAGAALHRAGSRAQRVLTSGTASSPAPIPGSTEGQAEESWKKPVPTAHPRPAALACSLCGACLAADRHEKPPGWSEAITEHLTKSSF